VASQTVPVWITIASSLSVGSFIGSLISQLLSTRQRRREWIKDNKKQEWRELISTLSKSFRYILNNSFGLISDEQERGIFQADFEATSAIEDRIFIAHQIQRENISERWRLLVAEKDWSRMLEYWNSLHKALVMAAHEDLNIKEHN
jgi:hypothetical protein